jgi:hypothetical protein
MDKRYIAVISAFIVAIPAVPICASPALPAPAAGRYCDVGGVQSTGQLKLNWPISIRDQAHEIVSIRAISASSGDVLGWLYRERNGDLYIEPSGQVRELRRTLLNAGLTQRVIRNITMPHRWARIAAGDAGSLERTLRTKNLSRACFSRRFD